jgi:hypothetical protein
VGDGPTRWGLCGGERERGEGEDGSAAVSGPEGGKVGCGERRRNWAGLKAGKGGRERLGVCFLFSTKPFKLKHFSKSKHYKPFSKFSNHFKDFQTSFKNL